MIYRVLSIFQAWSGDSTHNLRLSREIREMYSSLALVTLSVFGLALWLSPIQKASEMAISYLLAAQGIAWILGIMTLVKPRTHVGWYSFSLVLLGVAFSYDPAIVLQCLTLQFVLIRLVMPRFMALMNIAVLTLALAVQAGLQGLDEFDLFFRFASNAWCALMIVDALLRNYKAELGDRRLTLLQAVLPILAFAMLVRLTIQYFTESSVAMYFFRVVLLLCFLALPWFIKYYPRTAQRAFDGLIGVAVAGLSLAMWFEPSESGVAIGFLIVVVVVATEGWIRALLTFILLLLEIVYWLSLPAVDVGDSIAMLTSSLGLVVLLGFSLFRLNQSRGQQTRQSKRDLDITRAEKRNLSGRYLMYFMTVIVLSSSVIFAGIRAIQWDQLSKFEARNLDWIEDYNHATGSLIDQVVLFQRQIDAIEMVRPGVPKVVGQGLIAISDRVVRWRWLNDTGTVIYDTQNTNTNIETDASSEDSRLRRAVRIARSLPQAKTFISRVFLADIGPTETPIIMLATAVADSEGRVRGFSVADISVKDHIDFAIGLVPGSLGLDVSIIDADGNFIYQRGLGFNHASVLDPDDSLSINDSAKFFAIVRTRNGHLTWDGREIIVKPISFIGAKVNNDWFWGPKNEGFLVIEVLPLSNIRAFFALSSVPMLWLTLMLIAAILIAVLFSRSWLLGQRLQHHVQEEKALQLLAEHERDNAVQAEQAKVQFLSNMSHEMRTPLNGIVGIADILDKDHSQTNVDRFKGMLLDSCERLSRLIDDILDMGMISRGELMLAPSLVDFSVTINNLFNRQKIVAQRKGLLLELDSSGLQQPWRFLDEQRVGQIVDNLITNALKFTDHGSVKLVVQTTQEGIHLSVEDTGVGMTEEVRQRIFSRFEQGDLSIKKRHQGAGLGLSISHELVELMQGSIEVSSELEVGSRFDVYLPISAARPPDGLASSLDAPQSDESSRPKQALSGRILLVEDHVANAMSFVQILGDWGLDIVHAMHGAEALSLCERQSFDLVIADLAMPIMDGEQLFIELRQKGIELPCLLVTGNASMEDIGRLQLVGFDGIYTKPVKFEVLRERIARILAAKVNP